VVNVTNSIKRAHYDAARRKITTGMWVIDTDRGAIWSNYSKSWLRPFRKTRGYFYVSVNVNKRSRSLSIHRVIWEHVNGPIQGHLEINHRDGNKANNSIHNLELVTSAENDAHAASLGLRCAQRGSKHSHSRLTEEDVLVVRQLCGERIPHKVIATRFGISRSAVSMLNTGRTWSWL
jgi:hypothetical protein